MKWNWLNNGIGTCGEYECNGWRISCDGIGFRIKNPNNDYYYKKYYATIGTAKRNAEKMMIKGV